MAMVSLKATNEKIGSNWEFWINSETFEYSQYFMIGGVQQWVEVRQSGTHIDWDLLGCCTITNKHGHYIGVAPKYDGLFKGQKEPISTTLFTYLDAMVTLK